MKIISSSKALSRILEDIPDNEFIERVNLEDDELILITQTKTLKIPVHIIQFEASVKQDNRRWDGVARLMSGAPEQPVVLEIHDKIINVIFQY